MKDNIFSAVLTFGLLAAGTAAIGSEMFNARHDAPAARPVVTLPRVSIVAHRQASADFVMLPAVTITGHRDATTRVAAARASGSSRVE